MFYPDCGFWSLKMARPNLVLFKTSKHLLSSAYPKTPLLPAHSVTHLPNTWQALSRWKQGQSVPLPGTVQSAHSQLPLRAHTWLPAVRCLAVLGALPSPLLVWCLCSPALSLISSYSPRQLFQRWKRCLWSRFFIPVPSSSLLKSFPLLETSHNQAGIKILDRRVRGEEV